MAAIKGERRIQMSELLSELKFISAQQTRTNQQMEDQGRKIDNLNTEMTKVNTKLETLPLHMSPCNHSHKQMEDDIKKVEARGDRNDIISSIIAAIPGVGAVLAWLASQK